MADGSLADTLYPLTIILDRYNGAYSHGRWTAWNLHAYNIPEEIEGRDVDCMVFWWNIPQELCFGIGDSPDEAVKSLEKKLKVKVG